MENIVLSIHLILALVLIGVVLVQRSEGGGLGMGSSSNNAGGVMTGRQAANALTRLTWIVAICFLITSATLTILASRGQGSGSIFDRFTMPPASQQGTTPGTSGGVELPPPVGGVPAAPSVNDAPVTPPPAQ